ncbi:WAT1-related protein At5g64700-like isoform X3 [Phalaenopsis equestris]|uniref:WAT1-related protein At5g64700-like isoform X3 n=1 Tax=Phalaenopsis equestris TaxID=78828 RepID=UPI0009E57472|nr:WAT1-related protein At5g64700-like isoform X3 [Phalaenopsis equestris]
MAAWKHYSAIIFVQLLMAVMNLLGKTAFNRGMSTFVFVFYRQVVATVFLTPLAIIFTRKTAPPTSFKMLVKIFMLSLLGFPINLNLQSVVVNYTSATVASAALNLMPVFTFLLTVLLRIETFRLKSMSGIAKLSGFVLCVTGVMLIALYKGPQLKILNFHQPFLQSSGNHNYSTESRLSWILGSFLVFVVAIFWALWTVLQGVFIAGLALYLQSWCNDKKGPFFVAAFSPLALVFTITIASVILGERTNLGSVFGCAFIVGGLYGVLWGKSRDNIPSGAPIESAGEDLKIGNEFNIEEGK